MISHREILILIYLSLLIASFLKLDLAHADFVKPITCDTSILELVNSGKVGNVSACKNPNRPDVTIYCGTPDDFVDDFVVRNDIDVSCRKIVDCSQGHTLMESITARGAAPFSLASYKKAVQSSTSPADRHIMLLSLALARIDTVGVSAKSNLRAMIIPDAENERRDLLVMPHARISYELPVLILQSRYLMQQFLNVRVGFMGFRNNIPQLYGPQIDELVRLVVPKSLELEKDLKSSNVSTLVFDFGYDSPEGKAQLFPLTDGTYALKISFHQPKQLKNVVNVALLAGNYDYNVKPVLRGSVEELPLPHVVPVVPVAAPTVHQTVEELTKRMNDLSNSILFDVSF